MIPNTIITIDPGSSNGGIAVWQKGKPVKVARMPKNENIKELQIFLQKIDTENSDIIVFIEKVQMFSTDATDNPGKQYRIKVMLANYERILALLMFIGIPYVEVYPQSWQSTLKLNKRGLSKKDKKNSFKEFAQYCFPEIKVTLWSSDALCLVQFALIKYGQDIAWILKRIKNDQKNTLFK